MVLSAVHILTSTGCLTFLQLSLLKQLIFVSLLLLHSSVVSQQVALNSDDSPNVRIEGSGLSHGDLNETVMQALNLCQVRSFLNGTRYRLLSSELHGEPVFHTKLASDRFQATVYDYTHGRTLLVNGIPFDPTTVSTTEVNTQPFSNAEELAEAARIAGVGSGDEIVLRRMPPFITREFPDGNSQRILNIAVTSRNGSSIPLYVNMNNRTVESQPGPTQEILACEAPPPARASSNNRGVPGTANFVISQGGRQLWTFQAIRPSASSGTKGSAIELRNVKYKGKTVLFRAHVPILNVEYEQQNTSCGPHYRDWQWEEWPLQCHFSAQGQTLLLLFDCVNPQPGRSSILHTPTEVISLASQSMCRAKRSF